MVHNWVMPSPTPMTGRPRGFDPNAALAAALDVFWRQGYEATSLDDLTAAMGLSRSSFYACFASKHAVLLACVQMYADQIHAALVELAGTAADERAAVRAILTAIADPDGGRRGCFLVNSVAELAPHDAAVAAIARAHIDRVGALTAGLLVRAGFAPDHAGRRAGALLACAIGATTLRKAGVAAAQIEALLADAEDLLRDGGTTRG